MEMGTIGYLTQEHSLKGYGMVRVASDHTSKEVRYPTRLVSTDTVVAWGCVAASLLLSVGSTPLASAYH